MVWNMGDPIRDISSGLKYKKNMGVIIDIFSFLEISIETALQTARRARLRCARPHNTELLLSAIHLNTRTLLRNFPMEIMRYSFVEEEKTQRIWVFSLAGPP